MNLPCRDPLVVVAEALLGVYPARRDTPLALLCLVEELRWIAGYKDLEITPEMCPVLIENGYKRHKISLLLDKEAIWKLCCVNRAGTCLLHEGKHYRILWVLSEGMEVGEGPHRKQVGVEQVE